jgi:hypothetical protein
MENVIITFITKYNLIEHYFIDIKPSYCYDNYKYKSIDLTESIDFYHYFQLDLDQMVYFMF